MLLKAAALCPTGTFFQFACTIGFRPAGSQVFFCIVQADFLGLGAGSEQRCEVWGFPSLSTRVDIKLKLEPNYSGSHKDVDKGDYKNTHNKQWIKVLEENKQAQDADPIQQNIRPCPEDVKYIAAYSWTYSGIQIAEWLVFQQREVNYIQLRVDQMTQLLIKAVSNMNTNPLFDLLDSMVEYHQKQEQCEKRENRWRLSPHMKVTGYRINHNGCDLYLYNRIQASPDPGQGPGDQTVPNNFIGGLQRLNKCLYSVLYAELLAYSGQMQSPHFSLIHMALQSFHTTISPITVEFADPSESCSIRRK